MRRPVIARSGEQVTCENGHKIATVRRQFGSDDLVSPELFEFEDDVMTPQRGMAIDQTRCYCGKRWVRDEGWGVVEIHINGEWR